MRAVLSIVIPTLHAEHILPPTLQCLFEGISAGLIRELVISDGGSDDATLAIADAAGAVLVSGPPSRGGQLLRGAELTSGSWILFLHADTHLPEGWSEAAAEHIRRSGDAAAFRLKFRAKGLAPRFVAAWANQRSRIGLPYGDQGLLISRQLYDSIGGYSDIPLMEDVDIARRFKGRLRLLGMTVTTDADRYLQEGWLRRGSRNLLTLARYLAGVPPEELAKSYGRGAKGQISSHPL